MIDRRRRRQPVSELPDDELITRESSLESVPSTILTTKLQHKEMVKTLEQLREDYRTVLVLRFFNNLTTQETSDVMGRSTGAVRVLQHRALSTLRKLLPAQGFDL